MEKQETTHTSTTSDEQLRIDKMHPARVLDPIAYPRFPRRPPKLRFARLDRSEKLSDEKDR